MAYLKHLALPYKAKAGTKLWQPNHGLQESHLGCALRQGPRGITDPESQHIQTPTKKLPVAWEWVGYQLPAVTSTPNL